ncbi:LysR family transcriptional regulator [soil metagenome]
MDVIVNLKAFLEVAKAGSFSEASRRLGIATSVVKKRIDQLEAEVGTPLFERSTRRMALTAAGRHQLPMIQRVVHDVDEVLAGIRKKRRRLDGHLRVKVPTTLALFYLGDMLNRFQEVHPGISMEVVVIDRPVNPLIEGFDIAIGMMPSAFGGTVEIALCQLDRLVVASPAYLHRKGRPAQPADLTQHDILNFQPTGDAWSFNGAGGPVSVTLDPRLSCNEGQMLLNAAVSGNGITALSGYIVRKAIDKGQLEVILSDYAMSDFSLRAWVPESRSHIARVQALVAFLQREFSPVAPWDRDGG